MCQSKYNTFLCLCHLFDSLLRNHAPSMNRVTDISWSWVHLYLHKIVFNWKLYNVTKCLWHRHGNLCDMSWCDSWVHCILMIVPKVYVTFFFFLSLISEKNISPPFIEKHEWGNFLPICMLYIYFLKSYWLLLQQRGWFVI